MSIRKEILHPLDAIHDLCVQFSPCRDLSLSPPTSETRGQQWNSDTSSAKKRQGHPCQYRTEDGEQAGGERGDEDCDYKRGNYPQVNVLQFLNIRDKAS